LIPSANNDPETFKIIAAMSGTTCSAAVFIMRSTVVAEKGWTINDLRKEKKDAFVSAAIMMILSGVIMAVGAGTLHTMGLRLNDSVELIHLFEPIGGKISAFILILGIVGAGLSTIFPIILIAPWLISDYTGKPRNLKSPMYRILGAIGMLFAFGLQFMNLSSPAMVIFSQAFQAMILPAVSIPIFILINRKMVMKDYSPGLKLNIGIACVILFAFLTTYFAIVGLF
jgi:Mn2+/Fe2+ NRAMP family transporter